MYIKDNKIIFEIVTCWNCEGRKEVKNYIPCENMYQRTNRKPCQICGGIGKYNHKSIGEKMVSCFVCEGEGKRQEAAFDTITKECLSYIINNANYIHIGNNPNDINLDKKFIADCYGIGGNHFCGYQDYIDHRQDNAETLLKLIKDGVHPMQVLNYIDKDGILKLNISYFGYRGGIEANCMDIKQAVTV